MLYYTPGYGYPPQTPYNPYNPYIPRAMVGSDGQFLGQRPYYAGPPYQHPVSSGYYQPPVHPGSQEPGSISAGHANANSIAGSTAPHKLDEKDGKKGTVHSGGARSQNFRPMTQVSPSKTCPLRGIVNLYGSWLYYISYLLLAYSEYFLMCHIK